MKLGLTERFGDEEAFLLKLVVKIHDLPGRSREKAGVFRFDAVRGAGVKLSDDALEVVGFFGSDLKVSNNFAGESVPQENDLAKMRAFFIGNFTDALATRYELFDGEFHQYTL